MIFFNEIWIMSSYTISKIGPFAKRKVNLQVLLEVLQGFMFSPSVFL